MRTRNETRRTFRRASATSARICSLYGNSLGIPGSFGVSRACGKSLSARAHHATAAESTGTYCSSTADSSSLPWTPCACSPSLAFSAWRGHSSTACCSSLEFTREQSAQTAPVKISYDRKIARTISNLRPITYVKDWYRTFPDTRHTAFRAESSLKSR